MRAYLYDAYGRIVTETGALENPYTYTGREFDEESVLYFYRACYYDARAGRFITEDPIGFGGGDENIYRYAFNNPINLTDPFGLTSDCSYYQKRCEEIGGSYYCKIAPTICNGWPNDLVDWDGCVGVVHLDKADLTAI